MAKMNEVGETVSKKLGTFMANKPVWVFLIVYTAITGLCFGFVYALMYLLALRWWGVTITIITIGVIWGASAHGLNKRKSTTE